MPVAAVRPFVDSETIDLTAPESASPPRPPATALHKKVNSVYSFSTVVVSAVDMVWLSYFITISYGTGTG